MQTIDISTASFKKTKKMESLLEKIKKYLDAMRAAGKKPSSIDIAKPDYNAFFDKAKSTLPPPDSEGRVLFGD